MSECPEVPPPFPYGRECPFDPPVEFSRWRAASPVTAITLWNGQQAKIVTGLTEVRQIFRDHSTFSSSPFAPGYPSLSEADAASKASELLPMIDPPLHATLRRALQPEFTVRRMAELRSGIEVLVSDLLTSMAGRRPPVDLVRAFAAPVPQQVTCRLLGVPIEDAEFFSACQMDRHDSTATQDTVRTADDRLAEYFDGVIQDRVQTPRADLSGRLVQRHVSTGELTPRQAASLLHVLLNGGFDTTRNMIAMATILLLDHSDQLEGLRKDPTGWPEAVEELLRYLSVVQYERRAVTADVDIGGQTLRQGEGVVTVLHAANRDPRAFEHPDELDLGRSDISHVAFGAGIHQCLGQPVARLILQVALPLLFTAFPTLRLHTPKEELRYSEGRTVWGPIELPVAW